MIDGCLNAGVPISAIGIQSHQHQGYWGKEKLEEVLERFAHFGLPIHFTENTLIIRIRPVILRTMY
ncbi:endo-1,4-beta-xylanase [Butyrivibrio sp. AE3009]|uniref:endo-1,4-beta-xylanase n=1 Tax=Butyrivibrio sp. AE3009 TaxID=1280666 RepID=UPI003FCC7ECD